MSLEIRDAAGNAKNAQGCQSSTFQNDRYMLSEAPSQNSGTTRNPDPNYVAVTGCTVTIKQPWWRTNLLRFCPDNGYVVYDRRAPGRASP